VYRTISSRTIFSHSRVTLVEDRITLADGSEGTYLKETGARDAVTILCFDPSGRILIEREYSYLPNDRIYQFPGGGVLPDEPAKIAASRELGEETGLHAGRLESLGFYLINHRRSSARMHVFIGTELSQQISATRDEYESDIDLIWLTSSELTALIRSGEIVNAPMLSAWALYCSMGT
jgi:8-oxo-dGTP pyrophosphatase MutT (NUDIX family)